MIQQTSSNTHNSQQATVSFEQIVECGERKFKLTGWKRVFSLKKLPAEYLKDGAYFFSYDSHQDSYIHLSTKDTFFTLRIGRIVDEKEFLIINQELKDAGYRLTVINKRIKENNKYWAGRKITIII